jgi:hypothetical protein
VFSMRCETGIVQFNFLPQRTHELTVNMLHENISVVPKI